MQAEVGKLQSEIKETKSELIEALDSKFDSLKEQDKDGDKEDKKPAENKTALVSTVLENQVKRDFLSFVQIQESDQAQVEKQVGKETSLIEAMREDFNAIKE